MASLMDSIMNQYREKSAMRALPFNAPYGGLGGATESMAGGTSAARPMMMGAPSPMFSQPPMMMNADQGYGGIPTSNIPMPPPRPRDLPGRTPGFLDQLLSGPNYQSNNMPVDIRAQGPSMPGQEMPIQSINYGDPNSAADFFRADQLMMQNPNIPGFLGGY